MNFRTLEDKEIEEFKQWARDNYSQGDPISEVWHPVVREECRRINDSATQGSAYDAYMDEKLRDQADDRNDMEYYNNLD